MTSNARMWWLPPSIRAVDVSDTYSDRLVGREGEAVRVDEVVADDRQLAGRPVEPEDEAAAQLRVGLVALAVVEDAVRRIGEPDRAVGRDDDVVRRVEPLALVPVDDRRPRPVALVARDAARCRARRRGPCRRGRACGRSRSRTAGRARVGAVGRRPAAHDVAPDVAPDDGVLVGDVDRALGPGRAVGEPDAARRPAGTRRSKRGSRTTRSTVVSVTSAALRCRCGRTAGRRRRLPCDARPDGVRGRARS